MYIVTVKRIPEKYYVSCDLCKKVNIISHPELVLLSYESSPKPSRLPLWYLHTLLSFCDWLVLKGQGNRICWIVKVG
jgi:hypothetical protein